MRLLLLLAMSFGLIVPNWSRAADPQAEVVAHADPDEFYNGIGQPYVPYTGQPPGPDGIPKVNYDYLWGMATDGRNVWCGLGAGTAAIAAAQISLVVKDPPEAEESYSKGGILYKVEEYGESQYPYMLDALRPYMGDWRPPRIFQHDAQTGETVERTPNDPLLYITLGLRSAGVHNGVAIIAGPSILQLGICMFAFDAESGRYLGSKFMPEYSNIRRWVVANDGLYTSTLNTIQSTVRGSVLRWTGNRATPFRFEVVGNIDNEGAYLASHEGRLYVGTWASISYWPVLITKTVVPPPVCGLWMSPKIPAGGLRAKHANQWKKVWDPTSYDPDDVLVLSFSMGAMESYGGYLYFGTMEYPGAGNKSFQFAYGGKPPQGTKSSQTDRRPLILRGKDLDDPETATVELLYGPAVEWVFTWDGQPPVDGYVNGTWAQEPNKFGGGGIYGGSGFGDSDNRYTWSSAVHNGKLYFGTFDTTGTSKIDNVLDDIANGDAPDPTYGADIWRFDSTSSAAIAVTRNAFGHYAAHGFRNMVSTPYGLFLGTANSSNLLSDREDEFPDGGWELLKLVSEP